MKILIVDDNAVTRKYLRVLLAQEGHAVLEGEDGLEALHILQSEKIDAVISDILMPRMDGYRLCYEIRKNPEWNLIPLIAYTAIYTSSLDEQVALDFGADKFLAKPALPEAIIKALHEAVATKADHSKQFREPDELAAMKEYSEALVRKLEETNAGLSEAMGMLNERTVLAEFNADVSKALNRKEILRAILQLCAEAMVHHLEAAFARIWTHNKNDHVLELQASAGMYTHIDGGHARVPVGQFKIGRIASEQKPHLTNSVIGDPGVNDPEWAKREGMVSFAGYPLIVEERLVGVMAMFGKKPLSQNTLDAMASVAKAIAAGIERKVTENELRRSDERFRELAENIREIFFIAGPDGNPVHYVSPAFEEISGRSSKGFEGNPGFWLDLIHPDDRDRVAQAHRAAPEWLAIEYRMVRPDGSIRWMHTRTFPVQDETGKRVRLVGIAEDITDRKRAEQAAQQNLERIHALHEIDLAITSTLELSAVLNLLLEKLQIFLPHDAATVRLYNKGTQQLELVASRNIDKEAWKAHLSDPQHGLTHTWTVFHSRKPLAVRDLKGDSKTGIGGFLATQGLISFLGAPLIAKEDALGVLTLYAGEEHDFTGEEVEFLATVASQAAIAIHNVRLYEQTKRQAADLIERERIQRILKELSQDITKMDVDALLEKLTATIRDVFKVDVSDVRFPAGEKRANEIVTRDNLVQRLSESSESRRGATDWVVKNRKPIAIDDYLEQKEFTPGRVGSMFGARGFIAAPLLSKNGAVIGVIRALSKEPRIFTAREIDLFEQLANGAAIAIENEQLYQNLEQSNKVKSEFLSVMSHELRTPLNIIMGYSALLEGELVADADRQHHGLALHKIKAQGENLLGLITTIMEATHINSGATTVTTQRLDICESLKQLKAEYESVTKKDLILTWNWPDSLPIVLVDHQKLKRILQHLINNAVKFTETGTVTVSAKLVDPRAHGKPDDLSAEPMDFSPQRLIEFAVSDTGIGIPEESLPIIFDMFKQVDSSITRPYDGPGLGLYVVKQYTELLGGTIDVKSTEGGGSTFTVRIPCGSLPAPHNRQF